ncbi:EAL domain-containing protein [Vibrio sp. Sgm 5]|uniref:EAL domain-containing protein n=1 Tax=Vibrio sp. Sgm 5 TaxID=2994387 RepID=UPI0022499732|nr:EAL domain-containing protein [Vibrio sp. Sgm 5]MCX2792890.1 EAL domain-containing protein [Vibrio sp. Sgm 5]
MKYVVLDKHLCESKCFERCSNDGIVVIYVEDLEGAKTLLCREKIDVFFFDSSSYGVDGVMFITEIPNYTFPTVVVNTSSGNGEVDSLVITLLKTSGAKKVYSRFGGRHDNIEIFSILNDIEDGYALYNKNEPTESEMDPEIILKTISEGKLVNYYQPQYYEDVDKPISVEALARCEHPVYGLISPSVFIHLIDMDSLFWGGLERALRDFSDLPKDLKLSININQRTLQKPISKELLNLCSCYNFEPSRLTLELTEDEAFDGGVIALANVVAIRIAGIGLAIDDFGTGHSSLSQLVSLPFTELKLDRKFVYNIRNSYKNQEILKISMLLANSLGMNLIAEGVEEFETLNYIKKLGVSYYQGYFLSMPMNLNQLKELVF